MGREGGLVWVVAVLAWTAVGCEAKERPASTPAAKKAKPEAEAAPKDAEAKAPQPVALSKSEPATEAVAPVKEASRPKLPKKSPEEIKALRKQFMKLLAEGRRLVKRDKDYARGVEVLRQAVAIEPNNPKVLGELGHAARLAGNLQLARQMTRQAVMHARRPWTKGAVLYNLGRILEASGDKEEALEKYRESLAVRPNKTVEKRLKALEAGETPPGTPSVAKATCVADACDAYATSDKVCAALKDFHADEIKDGTLKGADDEPADWDCGDELDGDRPKGVPGVAILAATLDEGFLEYRYLAMRSKRGWHVVAALPHVYNPGAWGISEEMEVGEPRVRQLIPGGEPEVIIETSHGRGDHDMGINETESIGADQTLVCGWASKGGEPLCFARITTSYSYERGLLFEDEESEAEVPPEDHTEGLPIEEGWELAIRFPGDGIVEVVRTQGKPDEEHAKLLGRHRLHAMPLKPDEVSPRPNF